MTLVSLWLSVTLVLVSLPLHVAQNVSVSIPTMVNATEGDGTVEVCAELSADSAVPINIRLATPDIEPSPLISYTPVSAQLTFPMDATAGAAQCLVITLSGDDGVIERPETFPVTLTVITAGVMEKNNETTVTIIDNEVLSILPTLSVAENVQTTRVCVTARTSTGFDFSVTFINGTATSGNDFNVMSDIISAPAFTFGDYCADISIVSDDLFEGDETFTVAFINPSLGLTFDNNMAVITIIDNDVVTVSMPSTSSVPEGPYQFQVCATLTGLTAVPIDIMVSAMDNTAQSSSDYILDTPAITFSAESTNTECADITIIDDEVLEEEETFTVTIDVITPGVTEGNTVTTFTIRDDEVPSANVLVSVPATISVTEGDGTVQVCATLSAGAGITINNPISVILATSDGTAITTGADTASVYETLNIPASSTDGDSVCIDIAITDDDIIEADETFRVAVSTFAGLSMTTVTITDDDGVTLSVPPTLSVAEGDEIAQVCVTVSTAIDINITVTTSNGTATSGNDYMISDITIPADSTGEYCIHTSISILEDQMVEGDETFNVTLTPSPGLTLDNNVVAITITDNDDVTVLVAPATVVITEEAGSVQVCATLSAVAGVITAIPVYLTVTVNSDLSAVTNSDYVIMSDSLMFPTNSTNGSIQCVNITITDDDIFEADETFTVSLTSVTPGVSEIGEATVTITDNEVVTVSLPATTSVFVGDRRVEVCATLSGVTETPITITLVASNSTPVVGPDFDTKSTTLTFPVNSANTAMECVNFFITNDVLFVGDETFTVELMTTHPRVMKGNDTTILVTVTSGSTSESSTVIISSAVVAGVILLLVVAVVVVLVITVKLKHRANRDLTSVYRPPLALNQSMDTSTTPDGNPVYEDIKEYSGMETGFNITSCTAYSSGVTSAQLVKQESGYEVVPELEYKATQSAVRDDVQNHTTKSTEFVISTCPAYKQESVECEIMAEGEGMQTAPEEGTSTEFDIVSCPAYSTQPGKQLESDPREVFSEREGANKESTEFDITSCPAYTKTFGQPGKQQESDPRGVLPEGEGEDAQMKSTEFDIISCPAYSTTFGQPPPNSTSERRESEFDITSCPAYTKTFGQPAPTGKQELILPEGEGMQPAAYTTTSGQPDKQLESDPREILPEGEGVPRGVRGEGEDIQNKSTEFDITFCPAYTKTFGQPAPGSTSERRESEFDISSCPAYSSIVGQPAPKDKQESEYDPEGETGEGEL